MNQVLAMFHTSGPEAFSKFACQMAPFFSTINPTITQLREGYAVVEMPFSKEVTNHLGTLHAIALCNAAELAGGMMTNVSIPVNARWIPKSMQVNYLAKAKTQVTVIANGQDINWNNEGDIEVPISITDKDGIEVFTATITMNIKHT